MPLSVRINPNGRPGEPNVFDESNQGMHDRRFEEINPPRVPIGPFFYTIFFLDVRSASPLLEIIRIPRGRPMPR